MAVLYLVILASETNPAILNVAMAANKELSFAGMQDLHVLFNLCPNQWWICLIKQTDCLIKQTECLIKKYVFC